MAAVRTLCSKGILLSNGSVNFNGDILNCINYYGRETQEFFTKKEFNDEDNRPSTDNIELLSYRLVNNKKEEIDSFNYYEDVYIEIEYLIKNNKSKIYPNIHFFSHDDNYIFVSSARSVDLSEVVGYQKATIKIPKYTFNVGVIKIGIAFTRYPGTEVQFFINPAIITQVKEDNLSFRGYPYSGPIPGTTRIQLACDIQTN
jgi:lipopolysaccharide transport system ATP-binding protein